MLFVTLTYNLLEFLHANQDSDTVRIRIDHSIMLNIVCNVWDIVRDCTTISLRSKKKAILFYPLRFSCAKINASIVLPAKIGTPSRSVHDLISTNIVSVYIKPETAPIFNLRDFWEVQPREM